MLRIIYTGSYASSKVLAARIEAIFSGDEQSITPIESSEYARVFRFCIRETDDNGISPPKDFYYKEFLSRNWRDHIYLPFRGTRARRAHRGAGILLESGICAVESVCIGEQLGLGMIRRCFIVTAAVDNALGIEGYIAKLISFKGLNDKHDFIAHLGKTIGKMHRRGIVHGDLRLGNILVKEDYINGICLLDNERNRRYSKIPAKLRLKNLVQVNMFLSPYVTHADRLRFWKSYLEFNPELKSQEKKWLHDIAHRTRQRMMAKGYL